MKNSKLLITLWKLLLITLTILLINPVILFLISGSVWISILISLIATFGTIVYFSKNFLKPFANLWFSLLAVISFFIHLEVIFTFKFSEYNIEDLYSLRKNYYFNKPLLNKTFQDKEFLVQYKTNVQGFRIGSEDDPETKVEKCDWLFIGDSYTQGAQVEFEDLFTNRLWEYNPDKVIINAGVSGLGIVDEYYYYLNEGKYLNADKVFLQICNFNDFFNVKERSAGFSDYLMHYSNFARFLLYGFKYQNPAELPLGRWTEPFYPNVEDNIDYNIFYMEESGKKKTDLANFVKYFKKFAKEVQNNGAELIIIQIPTKEQTNYKYLSEVIESFSIEPSKLNMTYPNEFLANLCSNAGVKHIDLLEVFSTSLSSPFYDFDEHLNSNGHYLAAQSISGHLSEPEKVQSQWMSKLNVGDRYPVFSKQNDNLLTFQSWRDGNMELFLSDSLLNSPHRITWNSIDESHPWLSPNGAMLVFTEGDQSLYQTKVCLLDLSNHSRRYLTEEASTFNSIPSFSHDGNLIVYAEWQSHNGKLSDPYIVLHELRSDYKKSIRINNQECWRPILSPDNKTIYFISKQTKKPFDIYSYNILSNKTQNLTRTPFDEWDPTISNDGKWLAYSAKVEDNWDLFLLNLESNKVTRLTKTKGDEWDPSFSNCGKYLYYAGTFGLKNGISRIEIK